MTLAVTAQTPKAGDVGEHYLEAARSLLPLLRAEATRIEAARELTPAVHDALVGHNLLQLLLAPARGEGSIGIADVVRILETLATGDASTAWDVMAAMGGCFLSAMLPHQTAERMFVTPADAFATAVGRIGKATAVDGGYLVEARWPFLSGSPHATWIGGLCMVYEGDRPRTGADGQPRIVMPLLRKDRVTMLDTWDATGLRGTGSHEAEVMAAFVPGDEVADFARGPRPGLPPLYMLPEDVPAPLAAASVAIGIAQSALASFRELTARRLAQAGGATTRAPLPSLVLAESEARLSQAWAGVCSIAAEVDSALEAGTAVDERWLPRVSLAATSAAETAIAVVSSLYRAAGSSAVFTGSPLERALRDVFTVGAHRMLQRENYLLHGPALFA